MDPQTATRRCRRCQESKPITEFPAIVRNGTTRSGSYCRPCKKTYQHEWYLKNREHALAKAADRRAAARAARPLLPERRPLPEAVGFRAQANPRIQGNIGLGVAIAYFTRVGALVAIPLTDTQRYDLIIDREGVLQRVQVRTTTFRPGKSYLVPLVTTGANRNRIVRRPFPGGDYDSLMVVCGDATVYLIPASLIRARYQLALSRRWDAYRLED